jgi:hypothetical protein
MHTIAGNDDMWIAEVMKDLLNNKVWQMEDKNTNRNFT